MIPKYPTASTTLHAELKSRVNQYFEEGSLQTRGDRRLYPKAIFFVCVLIALYIHLVFFTPVWYFALLECVALGLTITGIGFNIMHDGSHGSFSTHAWMNWMASASLECLGGSSYMWKMKHCMLHHSFTNVEGYDDDIDIGNLMRVNEHQRRYPLHRFQHIYFWFLYMWVYILWIFQRDYQRYFSGKIANVAIPSLSRSEHILFWSGKVLNAAVFMAVPIVRVGFLPWLVGFVVTTMTAGLALTIVFQLAHTIEHTDFPLPHDVTNILPDEYALHQISTTANFATRSRMVTWFVGGLNFQIEHHLFPRVAHVHYPQISRIVKQVCVERNVSYLEHATMRKAVAAHVRHLRGLGRA